MTSRDTKEVFARLSAGDVEALGTLLQHYRPHLRRLAQRDLDSRTQARVDPSDVVQQTLLEAYRDFESFRGKSAAEFIGWLRRVLNHNLIESVERHLMAQKRAVSREKPQHESQPFQEAAGRQSTPSQRLMRNEAVERAVLAMEDLPRSQREAICLRHLEGWTLKEIASHFNRSEAAVAGLLKRGLRTLKKNLHAIEK